MCLIGERKETSTIWIIYSPDRMEISATVVTVDFVLHTPKKLKKNTVKFYFTENYQ